MDEGLRREDLAVHVRRENVFEDSFRELHRRSPEEWKNRFYIVFEGEEGQDAGGLLREWYVIISKEIFNPMYALFKTSQERHMLARVRYFLLMRVIYLKRVISALKKRPYVLHSQGCVSSLPRL